MGFLGVGDAIEWTDTEEYYRVLEYVIKHGALQFLEVFNKVKNRRNDELKWGDEVEFHLFVSDENNKRVRLNLVAHDLLERLSQNEKSQSVLWHPEFGDWMIESTPAKPFNNQSDNLIQLEAQLMARREMVYNELDKLEKKTGERYSISSLAAWPRMGCKNFVDCYQDTLGPIANSKYLPDRIINPHPRFGTLVRNIRKRRGRNVDIKVPLANGTDVDMDAMGFGMGCCCLQVTFQARDLKESRYLYDQLAVLAPIFLSLSAASPIFRGKLTERDARWDVISAAVDSRTPTELGHPEEEVRPKSRGSTVLPKSRYDSISMYISDSDLLKQHLSVYNDLNPPFNAEVFKAVDDSIDDEILAKHIAHLFTRDPLVIFGDRVEVDDKTTTEHFENIQSTNWQSVRWKPPPYAEQPDQSIGWRVEFRTMELQMTDFENAAYTIAVVLLSRVILFFGLNLYIPLSEVDKNMKTAHLKDSVINEKFLFRKNLVVLSEMCSELDEKEFNTTEDMTIEKILTGDGEFPGLFPLIYAYLDIINCDDKTLRVLSKYLDFLSARASGKVHTAARYLRNFVEGHELYGHDLNITEEIEYDLVNQCDGITRGTVHAEELLGNNVFNTTVEGEGGKRKLRGASFRDELGSVDESVKQSECSLILELIGKYKGVTEEHIVSDKQGFAETKPYLSS